MTSLAAAAIAPPPAGIMPPRPTRLIARRAPKPIPRRSKVARPSAGRDQSADRSYSTDRSSEADQEAALEDLSATSSLASDIIKSCPASAPLTPVGRLDAAEQRLDATIKAIHILRSPLERFYRALSDEQRRQFNAINGSTEGARPAGDMATLCGQQAGSFIDLPVQRIEQVVQPTAQQQSAFDDLKKAAQKAGDQLQSACPTAVPKSPLARLDTVEKRLGRYGGRYRGRSPSPQELLRLAERRAESEVQLDGAAAKVCFVTIRTLDRTGGRVV
jgi:hypothetical protein